MSEIKKTVKLTKDSAPVVNYDDVAHHSVDLAKSSARANICLSKKDLFGIRAQVVLILDYSGSMERDYREGTIQKIVDRALAFGLQVDVDGTIPVIPFSSSLHPTVQVDIYNYQGVVQREIMKARMGSTNLTAALIKLKEMAAETKVPIFAFVVGDGDPDDKRTAEYQVCDLAGYPVFLKFLAIRPVDWLEELEDLENRKPGSRLLDNVDTKFIPAINHVGDVEFFDMMVDEWGTWIKAAQEAGVLE